MTLEKSRMLLQVRRFPDAEQEARAVLRQTPNNSEAHMMLALALLAQGRNAEALQVAQTAVHLAPNVGYTHNILSVVYRQSNNFEAARRASMEAVRLNPLDAGFRANLAEIYVEMERWTEALNATDEGLRLQPQHVKCLALRGLALVMLGKSAEARPVLDTALSLEPENPLVHTVLGYMHFKQREYSQAFTSYGEALRLNPSNRLAQEGIVEAMKARNPVYRLLLGYFTWMASFDGKQRRNVLIGGYIAIFVGSRILRDTPLFVPLVVAYFLFVFLTWTSTTLFDLVLRLDRFGRRALSRERTIASNWVGLSLLVGTLLIIAGLLTEGTMRAPFIEAGVKMVALILPISGVFEAHLRKYRQILLIYTLALLGLVVWGLVEGAQGSPESVSRVFFVLGFIAYTWVGTIIIPRRS
jgi:tetratricopeptide (TPR) repeat protein